jgi:hypothetical protein
MEDPRETILSDDYSTNLNVPKEPIPTDLIEEYIV